MCSLIIYYDNFNYTIFSILMEVRLFSNEILKFLVIINKKCQCEIENLLLL